MTKRCFECDRVLTLATDFILCDGIGKHYFCLACSRLDRAEYKLVCDNRNIRWVCCKCIDFNVNVNLNELYTEIKNTKQLIEVNNKHMEVLKNDNKEMKKELSSLKQICVDKTVFVEKLESVANENRLIREELKQSKERDDKDMQSETKKQLVVSKQVKDSKQVKTNKNKNANKQPNTNKQAETFADIVKKNDKTIVVCPKNDQDFEATKQMLKQNVDPCNNNIKKIKHIGRVGIAIECETTEAVTGLRQEVEQKMGDDVIIKTPQIKKKMIKIIGMSDELDGDKMKEHINRQNAIDITSARLIKIYKIKDKERYNAILEVDEELINKLLKKKLLIGWDECKVVEHYNVLRCFNCLGFHHTAKECKNKKACKWCAEEHEPENCKSKILKCINCMNAREKFNLDIDDTHDAFNQECHVRMQMIKREKKKSTIFK